MAWATPPTASVGGVITAANWNILRDDLNFLANPPAARVYKAAAQAINNNTITAINFDTERYDTDTIHDTVTNNTRLTCKTAGLYHFEFSAEFAANATGFRGWFIRLNGSSSNYIAAFELPLTGAAVTACATIGADYRMAVNDFAEAVVWQTSGGALNIQAGGNTFSPEFSMRWVSL